MHVIKIFFLSLSENPKTLHCVNERPCPYEYVKDGQNDFSLFTKNSPKIAGLWVKFLFSMCLNDYKFNKRIQKCLLPFKTKAMQFILITVWEGREWELSIRE